MEDATAAAGGGLGGDQHSTQRKTRVERPDGHANFRVVTTTRDSRFSWIWLGFVFAICAGVNLARIYSKFKF